MESSVEVQRLKHVYQEYSERDLGRLKWSLANAGNRAIWEEWQRTLGKLLQKAGFLPLSNRRVLDVGCGVGRVLANFEQFGARPESLFGVDLLPERISAANEQFPALSFQQANAESLPFADGSFDIVVLFTVFTSIRNQQMRANISNEINRVLRPGGAIVWYDFRLNNPFNSHVRGICRKGIEKLFPAFQFDFRSITLLPPLARMLGSLTHRLYPILATLPFLRTHYLGILRKS
jgi:ubiquinone/menaquinone biosynthesis C-methylase UbiE